MLKTILVLALFFLVFYVILQGIDIIWKRLNLFPSQNQKEKQDCIPGGISTPGDAYNFNLTSHHAVTTCEVDLSSVCSEAATTVGGFSEGIQLVVENAGEHIGTILEGL